MSHPPNKKTEDRWTLFHLVAIQGPYKRCGSRETSQFITKKNQWDMISHKKLAINKIVRCLFDPHADKNSDPRNLMNPKDGKDIKTKSIPRNKIEYCKRKINAKFDQQKHD